MTTIAKKLAIAIAATSLLVGCAHHAATRVKATRPLTAEETHIVEIARRAVATNDAWADRLEFELPQRTVGGEWSVLVWRLPPTPGGFRVITIDEKDRVTRYHRGY